MVSKKRPRASLSVDNTTWSEIGALGTPALKAAAVVAALTQPITVEIRNASNALMGGGTMDGALGVASGPDITIGEATGSVRQIGVTTSGTPAAGWYLQFVGANSRKVRGSFGLPGSGAAFIWSLPTFTQGQIADLGTPVVSAE
jgi:hypothetical protein